ncbi:MAG TPA: Fis family transcriptional regulator [Stellaceae bacterium]|nr:Fis family transcriptional regulator [Stellaceae bacterium]
MTANTGKTNPHIGSDFDDFLVEEGIDAVVVDQAWRKVIAYMVADWIRLSGITKAEMARRMHTSRTAVDRLLDPNGAGITIDTLDRAALAVGKRLVIEFEDREAEPETDRQLAMA